MAKSDTATRYKEKRREETRGIKKFVIHFLAPFKAGDTRVECGINEPFRIECECDWVNSADIKIDVFDLREGDNVDICGVRGRITEIEVVLEEVSNE